jgi:polysaccharide export outer membrane protein
MMHITHTFSPRSLATALLTAATLVAVPAVTFAQAPVPTRFASDPKAPAESKAKPDAPPPVSADYRLNAGDKLRISVYKDPGSSLDSVQVRPDGKITMPFIGDLDATGHTTSELREAITHSLKEYVNNPVVTVIVLEATTPVVFVLGEVGHPGTVKLEGPMTVLQALAVAGGLKDFANEKNIRILRKGPNGTETIPFNYRDATRGHGSNPYLQPGDTVVVPD